MATSDSPKFIKKKTVDGKFNPDAVLPFQLRLDDFRMAMQDVYDFFYDVNSLMREKGLERLDDMLRPANLSGMLSDMLTASVAKHSRTLTQNCFHNGHPDLVVRGIYPKNSIKAGEEGVEIKATRKQGGAVDFHGARELHLCVFVYRVDNETEPATARTPLEFSDVYLAHVVPDDFRKNPRGALGTPTATLHAEAIAKYREGWIYRA